LPTLLTPVIGVANADMALRQQADGCLRMSSGAVFSDTKLTEEGGLPKVQLTQASLAETKTRIERVLPAATNACIARYWGGLLDMTPDALPVIDYLPGTTGVVVAAGFSGHGFGIGPAVGETVADLVLQKKPRLPVAAFAFDRFAVQFQSNDQMGNTAPALHG
jgi:sarcosine oxidase subunit beta